MMLNMPLKLALVESGKKQEQIADLAKIHNTRLSQIVHQKVTASESEQLRLAGVLGRPVRALFPTQQKERRTA
jgi:transcriptional regulator with XRE-family HTH domain